MASDSIFARRLRASSKVGPDYDQEGRLIKVETREDEGQKKKLEEIVELLVAAGYFRARIKGLSPFDKVVGGLTWCISTCDFDIDVDLLFQENSTIGQKISLTEKIVVALKGMQCPSNIEPHQIQGLDFKSIFPVIQWLVRKAIETRNEMGDIVRAFAISQYDKHFSEKQNDDDEIHLVKNIKTFYSVVKDANAPKRKYKRKTKSEQDTEEMKVSSTLLEYGSFTGVKVQAKRSKADEQYGVAETKDEKIMQEELEGKFAKVGLETEAPGGEMDEEQKIQEQQEKTIESLMRGMKEITAKEIGGKVTARTVGNIVELQSTEIKEITTLFAEKRAELKEQREKIIKKEKPKVVKLTDEQKHALKLKTYNMSINKVKKEVATLEDQTGKLYNQKQELEEKLSTIVNSSKEVESQKQELDTVEANVDAGILHKLRQLVALNESLKKQETQFKQHCREESSRMKAEIQTLKENTDNVENKKSEVTSKLDVQLEAGRKKLSRMRNVLAEKNREVAALLYKTDEIPSRAELTQYQRRFVELYDQISVTHKETKNFYAMYNTLEDKTQYLRKQVDLLDSIYDNFSAAQSNPDAMQQYLRQFEKIVEGVKSNKLKVEKRQQELKMDRDRLKEELLKLVEMQREYVKMIRDFHEECDKNEILVQRLTALGVEC